MNPDQIDERARHVAAEWGIDEDEAREEIAIATGLDRGCIVVRDGTGRIIPEPRQAFDEP
jgi:hypothetical protein